MNFWPLSNDLLVWAAGRQDYWPVSWRQRGALSPGRLCRWRRSRAGCWRGPLSGTRRCPTPRCCQDTPPAPPRGWWPPHVWAPGSPGGRRSARWWCCWCGSAPCCRRSWWCSSPGPRPRPRHQSPRPQHRASPPGARSQPLVLCLYNVKVYTFLIIYVYIFKETVSVDNSPRKVLQMYSEIWFPDFDSENKLSSLLSIRLNWKVLFRR